MLSEPEYNYKLASVFKHNPAKHVFDVKVGVRNNFEIIISQVALGASFRLTSRSINDLRSRGALSYLGCVTEEDVSTCVQVLTAISLQKIAHILTSNLCWAYSIAFDAGTNHGESFIDVRCRVCSDNKIHNFHLLATSDRKSHRRTHFKCSS